VNSGALEGLAIPAPLETPVVLLLNDMKRNQPWVSDDV